MAGGSKFHLSCGGTKSGVGIPSSLCFGAAFFLATAVPKGPAPGPRAIGCSITQAVPLAIVAAYRLAIDRVGTPTHAVAPVKGSRSLTSSNGGSATRSIVSAAACLVAAPNPPMAENLRSAGSPLLLIQQQHQWESQDPSS